MGANTLAEITEILSSLGMNVIESYADFEGMPSSDDHIQLLVCSEKRSEPHDLSVNAALNL